MTAEPVLLRADKGAVAVLTLHRPARRNALTPALHDALHRALSDADKDPAVRAVVLTGAGAAFSAGGDIHDMAARPLRRAMPPAARARERDRERERLRLCYRTVRTLLTLRSPVVAAVNGPAVGAGVALALACDIRVLARSARLSLAFANLALPGDTGISGLLGAALGRAAATCALTRAATWDAADCQKLGLADEVTDDPAVVDAALRQAATLAASPIAAHGDIRARPVDLTEADALAEAEIEATLRCQETQDHEAALAAFLSRRTSES